MALLQVFIPAIPFALPYRTKSEDPVDYKTSWLIEMKSDPFNEPYFFLCQFPSLCLVWCRRDCIDFQHVKPKEGNPSPMPHFIKYYHEVETNFLSGREIVNNVDRRQIKSAFLRLLVSSNSFFIISLRLSISLAIP